MIRVKCVESNAELKKFMDFPQQLYEGETFFVPAAQAIEQQLLNPPEALGQMRLYLALVEKEVCGRMALFFPAVGVGTEAAIFRLDFIDDAQVSAALIESACQDASQRGYASLCGPRGALELEPQGAMALGQMHDGSAFALQQPEYFLQHLEGLGFTKIFTQKEYRVALPDGLSSRETRYAEFLLRRQGVRLLPLENGEQLSAWVEPLFKLIASQLARVQGRLLPEVLVRARLEESWLRYADLRFIHLYVDRAGELAGAMIALPDMAAALRAVEGRHRPWNKRKFEAFRQEVRTLELIMSIFRPEYIGTGLRDAMLINLTQDAVRQGMKFITTGPLLPCQGERAAGLTFKNGVIYSVRHTLRRSV